MARDDDAKRVTTKWAVNATEGASNDVLFPYTAADPPSPLNPNLPSREDGWGSAYSANGAPLPTRQVFNGLFRELSALLVEINGHGILEWDSGLTYTHPAFVAGTDSADGNFAGKLYVSVQNSTGQNPGTDTASAYWQQIGAPGADGAGVPAGGTVGQYLRKNGADYEAEWAAIDKDIHLGDVMGFVALGSPFG